MDWHSSGITTSVLGALKRGLEAVQDELGLYVCGGRGRHSRKTPHELAGVGSRTGLDGDALARASRLVAKVDSAAVQDGFSLYLHGFIVSASGEWVVVQQGLNPQSRTARRYHWRSERVRDFLDSPHEAIEGEPVGEIVNLADRRAAQSRAAQLALLGRGPDFVVAQLARPTPTRELVLPHLSMPAHHEVTEGDVVLRRLHARLAAAAERAPVTFPELLLTPGVGARTVAALAHVAEVIHGAPCRFSDPARFSMAHGGKDGHPFPVPLAVYDQTIRVMKDAVARARLGNGERLEALRRLDAQARAAEGVALGAPFKSHVEQERAESFRWAGRTVSGWARAQKPKSSAQLSLFGRGA